MAVQWQGTRAVLSFLLLEAEKLCKLAQFQNQNWLWRHSKCCSPAEFLGILIRKLNATCWKDLASTAVKKCIGNWAVAQSTAWIWQIGFLYVVESTCWVPAPRNPTKRRRIDSELVKVVPKGQFPLVLLLIRFCVFSCLRESVEQLQNVDFHIPPADSAVSWEDPSPLFLLSP